MAFKYIGVLRVRETFNAASIKWPIIVGEGFHALLWNEIDHEFSIILPRQQGIIGAPSLVWKEWEIAADTLFRWGSGENPGTIQPKRKAFYDILLDLSVVQPEWDHGQLNGIEYRTAYLRRV